MTNDSLEPPKSPEGHPNPVKWYQVRRQTMFRTLISMFLMMTVILVMEYTNPGFVTEAMGELIKWYFLIFSLPTVGFYSNTAVDAIVARKVT